MYIILWQSQHDPKIQKKKEKISQTHFGPAFGTGSEVSTDPDMGIAKLDPRIRVRIWVLLLKTDLNSGPPEPDPRSE